MWYVYFKHSPARSQYLLIFFTAAIELNEFIDEESEDEETETAADAIDSTDDAQMDAQTTTCTRTRKRGRINWITPRVTSALDNAKVSDTMAVHILVAVAEALGHRVDELVLNRTTLHQ